MNDTGDEDTTPPGGRDASCNERPQRLRPARDWNIHQVLHWIVHRAASGEVKVAAEAGNSDQASADQEYEDALMAINEAVGQGLVAAYGRPSDTWREPTNHRPRQQVPADLIDERRRIDVSGWCRTPIDGLGFDWLKDYGPFFHEIRFRIAEIKKIWPLYAAPALATAADRATTPDCDFEPLAATLEDCFNSEAPFVELKNDVQGRIARAMGLSIPGALSSEVKAERVRRARQHETTVALLPESVRERNALAQALSLAAMFWQISSPSQRRARALRRDIEGHPDLAAERHALWEKSLEINKWDRVGSSLRIEDLPPADLATKANTLARLRAEEAALEATLRHKAEKFGLVWPYEVTAPAVAGATGSSKQAGEGKAQAKEVPARSVIGRAHLAPR